MLFVISFDDAPGALAPLAATVVPEATFAAASSPGARHAHTSSVAVAVKVRQMLLA
jgi:hypothetical protein